MNTKVLVASTLILSVLGLAFFAQNVNAAVTTSLNVQKTVQDITNGTVFGDSIVANFDDVVIYKVIISSGPTSSLAVYAKDTMPSGITYLGSLTIDGVSDNRSIADGILLGDIATGTVKTITYRARVNTKEFFNFGTSNLINAVLVYNNVASASDTATVVVKKAVAGAVATNVNTGITDNLFGSLLLPLSLAALLLFIFKSQLLGFDKWVTIRKEQTNGFRAQKKLNSLIKKRK